MRRCVGQNQKRIRRAFIYANGAPVQTATLMAWCYPELSKFERWHWWSVSRAAHKFGTNISRGWWQPNNELMRRLKPSGSKPVGPKA